MRKCLLLVAASAALLGQTRTQTIHVGEPVTNAPGGNPGRTTNKTGKNIPNGLPQGPGAGGAQQPQQPQPSQPSQAPVGAGCPGNITQVCDAQVLAKVLFERYSSGYPIRVVRLSNSDMPQTWLVLLAGTEFNILAQSNTPLAWLEAFQVSSKFRQEVAQVITSWAPAGSNLIMVGHSLGGMVAQNLAADSTFRGNYKGIDVITYGSPKTVEPVSGIDYVWFAAVNDIVPTINPLNLFSQPPYIWVTVSPLSVSAIGVHIAYPTSTDLANYDGLGHKFVSRVLAWVRTGTFPGKCLTLDQSMSWCATAPAQ